MDDAAPPSRERSLLRTWSNRLRENLNPSYYLAFCREALASGEALLAADAAREALDHFPDAGPAERLALRQSLALALARAGSVQTALVLLDELIREGAADSETHGLQGSAFKSLAAQVGEPGQRAALLRRSRDAYLQGFREHGDAYNGINAAALLLVLGDTASAHSTARAVLGMLERRGLPPAPPELYWHHATLAEARLILGQVDEAAAAYREACRHAAGRWADLASTTRQARLLAEAILHRPRALDACFSIPVVALASSRPLAGGPDAPLVQTARRAFADLVGSECIGFGVFSASPGTDLLLAESIRARGGECHIILPTDAETFRERRVAPADGGAWLPLFDRVTGAATSLEAANGPASGNTAAAEDFHRWMLAARARALAQSLGAELRTLLPGSAPADPLPPEALAARALWRRHRLPEPVCLHADGSTRDPGPSEETGGDAAAQPFPHIYLPAGDAGCEEIRAFLVAEIRGADLLRGKEVPAAGLSFRAALADRIAAAAQPPLVSQALGNTFLLVLPDVRSCGRLSLALAALEAPAPSLRLGMGLHIGPAFLHVDPLLHQYTYDGANIEEARQLAARAEPGAILCSSAFAAIVALDNILDFTCEYVGRRSLAPAGTPAPLYRLQPQALFPS